MLNRVASELVDIAMKQNDASKKVSLCGMMLWVTIFSEGMTHSQALDLMKPLSSIFICFLHVSPTSFLVGVFQIMHKHLHLFHAIEDGHTVNQCTVMAPRGRHVPHGDKDPFCYAILETLAVKQLNH